MAKEISNSDDYIDSRDVEERIEELEDSLSPRYVAGYNMPGYLPDSEPCEFDCMDDAVEHIRSIVEDLVEENEGENYALWEQYSSLLDDMKNHPSTFEEDFSVLAGKYRFWVKEDGEMGLDEYDQEELNNLRKLKEQCEGYSDWRYEETLIRESAFTDYVQDLCEDCGYISRDFPSWIEIDWERTASNVAFDYSTVDFDGVDYYIRS